MSGKVSRTQAEALAIVAVQVMVNDVGNAPPSGRQTQPSGRARRPSRCPPRR